MTSIEDWVENTQVIILISCHDMPQLNLNIWECHDLLMSKFHQRSVGKTNMMSQCISISVFSVVGTVVRLYIVNPE